MDEELRIFRFRIVWITQLPDSFAEVATALPPCLGHHHKHVPHRFEDRILSILQRSMKENFGTDFSNAKISGDRQASFEPCD